MATSWKTSVNLKLMGTLVLVTAATAMGLSIFFDQFTIGRSRLAAQLYLHGQLKSVAFALRRELAGNMARTPALERAVAPWQKELGARGVGLLVLGPRGRVWVAPLPGRQLPPAADLAAYAASKKVLVELHPAQGEVWLARVPLAPGGPWLAGLVSPSEAMAPQAAGTRQILILAALVLCALVGVFAIWLARRELSRPLTRLARQAAQVALGHRDRVQALEGRQDELGLLSRVLNQMTSQLADTIAQLKRSQVRFSQFFNDSSDGAFIVGPGGRLEEVNQVLADMFGYPSQQAMLEQINAAALFAQPQRRQQYLERVRREGFVRDFPFLARRADGSTFHALVTASSRHDSDGRFGFLRDVTRRHQAEVALRETEAAQRRLLDNSPSIIYRWLIAEARFDFISPAVNRIIGYEPSQILADSRMLFEILHPEDRAAALEGWRTLLASQAPIISEQEYRVIRADAAVRWLMERSVLVMDAAGKPYAIEGVASDITEKKLMEQAEASARRILQATLQGLPTPVMLIDRSHKVANWNRAMENLTGIAAERITGSSRQWEPFYEKARPLLADLLIDGDHRALKRLYGDKRLKSSSYIEGAYEAEEHFPSVGGRPRDLYFLAAPIHDDQGQVVFAVETILDLTDKRRLEEELRRLSVTDELSGLFNHRFFHAALSREVATAKRYNHPLSLLMLDLDRFKAFNDRYGHPEGDKVLAKTAAAILDSVRLTDLACRYGGEEFAVLLPRSSPRDAIGVAERIRRAVAALLFNPSLPSGQEGEARITISVGVAHFSPEMDHERLLGLADQALYAAKEMGRNRVVVYGSEGMQELAMPAAGTQPGEPLAGRGGPGSAKTS